jgi:hypothetical protein
MASDLGNRLARQRPRCPAFSGMVLPFLGHLRRCRLLPVRALGNVFRNGCLRCLPGLSLRHGNFQTIEHISYAIEEILDHERRFYMRERDVLGSLDVLAQLSGRGMGIDDSYAKADECMHLAGEELYIFVPRIRHQSHQSWIVADHQRERRKLCSEM